MDAPLPGMPTVVALKPMSDWLENPGKLLLGLLLILILIACMTLFGERGLLRLHGMQAELVDLADENGRLAEENRALAKEIERLRSDRDYLEKLAREELGMMGKGELVVQFPPGEPGRGQKLQGVSAPPSPADASSAEAER